MMTVPIVSRYGPDDINGSGECLHVLRTVGEAIPRKKLWHCYVKRHW